MQFRVGGCLLLAVTAAALPVAAAAPICAGDRWRERTARTNPVSETTLEIVGRSAIDHMFDHPNCAHGGNEARVGAKAKLLGGPLTGCQTDVLHEFHRHIVVLVDRHCSGLSASCYSSRGEHYYNQVFDKYSFGNQRCVTGGATGSPCPFNGCQFPGWTLIISRCRNPEVTDACGCCRRDLTPLLIDRSGDGLSVSAAKDGALFEIDGPGSTPVWVGWPLTTDDAWLAMDRTGNGWIDDGSELFGSATPLSSGATAEDGYQALADLDANGDQWVDALDPAFPELRLWADSDRNGVSEPRELVTLPAAGILGLAIDYWPSMYEDSNGNHFRYCAHVNEEPLPGENPSIERLSCDVYPDIAPAEP